MVKVKKALLVLLGLVSLSLGILGIFLPVLPTTPFLLLSAYLFARSSKRLHDWLLTNRFFGRYISNYIGGRGISPAHKVITISLLWTVILVSAIFFVSSIWIRSLLLLVAVAVTVHILLVRACRVE